MGHDIGFRRLAGSGRRQIADAVLLTRCISLARRRSLLVVVVVRDLAIVWRDGC